MSETLNEIIDAIHTLFKDREVKLTKLSNRFELVIKDEGFKVGISFKKQDEHYVFDSLEKVIEENEM